MLLNYIGTVAKCFKLYPAGFSAVRWLNALNYIQLAKCFKLYERACNGRGVVTKGEGGS